MPETQEKKSESVDVRAMKSAAVTAAMVEVLTENRTEIIKRARVKLKTLGIDVKDSDVGL